jgi:hypothetical protein
MLSFNVAARSAKERYFRGAKDDRSVVSVDQPRYCCTCNRRSVAITVLCTDTQAKGAGQQAAGDSVFTGGGHLLIASLTPSPTKSAPVACRMRVPTDVPGRNR